MNLKGVPYRGTTRSIVSLLCCFVQRTSQLDRTFCRPFFTCPIQDLSRYWALWRAYSVGFPQMSLESSMKHPQYVHVCHLDLFLEEGYTRSAGIETECP